MQRTLLENVKRRLWHYLNPDVAAYAGLKVQDLQHIISGTYTPTDDELNALATRMHLTADAYPDTKVA